jgi:translation initiation factor IF-1
MEKNGKNLGSSTKEGEIAVGTITEALPNTLFRVSLGEDKEILAYLSGKMRLHRIRVLIGDRVEMVLDPYGGRGRITRRL